ncbi:aminopeptidase N [Lishizhenia tianjinensis]|uniref:Aminopeptidase N n=1 Tax=Lishizhenia tianjinensis TaxID=477690 RepID=A0A1I7BR78_9FLAO|nr:M1 family metallopeptidase [Lishizhenia tianjinensis]SFT89611.1 aminopeptidase N [Lishizhenia tianjinensis]
MRISQLFSSLLIAGSFANFTFSQALEGIKQPVYHASETQHVNLIHTELEVAFDWENSALKGKEKLVFTPHYRPISELVLDAKSMAFETISMKGETLHYTYDGLVLKITLPGSFTRKDTLAINIVYTAFPEELEAEGSAAITEAKGLYFINPKKEQGGRMPQLWTQGETEASSAWFPTVDTPNQKHAQDIYITVEPNSMALSNGALIDIQKSEDAWVYHWKQELEHAPYLSMMAVGNFVEIKDSVRLASGRILPLSYYVEPEWQGEAKQIFGNTGEMIQHFSKLLGVEFPWDKYSQIIVRNFVSGAMENTSAVVFGDFVYRTEAEALDKNSDDIIAHELFHHWFGDLLTCESWSNLPLNESFANYSQYLWDEFKYGKEEAAYNAQQEAFGFYNSAAFAGHHNMIWFDYENKEDMFDGHSYNKGGRILHMLRTYLGDDLFFDAIKYYLEENSYQSVEIHNLRLAFEKVSGEDLNWFFNQWFLDDYVPNLIVNHEVKDSVLKVKIHQNQNLMKAPLYQLPLKFMVYTSKGNYTYNIRIEDEYEVFEFPLDGSLENFILDGDNSLLAEVSTDKPDAFFVNQYHQRENYLDRYEVLQAVKESSSEALKNIVLEALNDPFWAVRYEALTMVGKLNKDQRKKALNIIAELALKDAKPQVRQRALHLLRYKEKKSKLQALCVQLLKEDASWLVKGEALSVLGGLQPKLALEWAAKFEKEQANSILIALSDLYAEIGEKEQLNFFTSHLNTNTMNDGTYSAMLGAFTLYLKDEDISVLAENWKIYQQVAERGLGDAEKFVPLYLRSLVGLMEFRAQELQNEIDTLRKNNDVAIAAQKQKVLDAALSEIEAAKAYLSSSEERKH